MKNFLTNSRERYGLSLFIIGFSLLVWGNALNMDGLWWDDWALAWLYFPTDSFDQFMQLFRELRHVSRGVWAYIIIGALDFSPKYAMDLWNISRLVLFALNALLIFAIMNSVLRVRTVLPIAAAMAYLASPVVNNYTVVIVLSYWPLVSFFLLSILFSVRSVAGDRFRPGLYVLAVLCSIVTMVGLESFVFFELLRLAIFFYIFRGRERGDVFRAAKRSVICWLPFVLVAAAVMIDTVVRPQYGGYAGLYSTSSFSKETIYLVLSRYHTSMKYIFGGIYLRTVKDVLRDGGFAVFWLASAAAAIAAVFILNKRWKGSGTDAESRTAFKEALIVLFFGLFAVILGLLPYALTRGALMQGTESRHGLLANIGSFIMLPSGLLAFYHMPTSYFSRVLRRRLCLGFFALVIFVGALQCNYSVSVHKDNWEHLRSIWWQLAWRAPDIKDHTLMIIDMPWGESPGGGSFVLPPIMNIMYAKSRDWGEINNHFALGLHNAMRRGQSFSFSDNYDKDVVEFDTHAGPMRHYPKNLLVGSYSAEDRYLYLNDEITRPIGPEEDVAFLLSRASDDRIIYSADISEFPLRWVMGPEPAHDWRYYYQRANALNGMGDYAGIVGLFNEARESGFDLADIMPRNLQPFVKAFYIEGDAKTADALTQKLTMAREEDVGRR